MKEITNITDVTFKFQYDNTLRYIMKNLDYCLVLFKFQYDNTLSKY